MKYDSVLDQQSISGKIVSLILCVWKPGFVKSGHILALQCLKIDIVQFEVFQPKHQLFKSKVFKTGYLQSIKTS